MFGWGARSARQEIQEIGVDDGLVNEATDVDFVFPDNEVDAVEAVTISVFDEIFTDSTTIKILEDTTTVGTTSGYLNLMGGQHQILLDHLNPND